MDYIKIFLYISMMVFLASSPCQAMARAKVSQPVARPLSWTFIQDAAQSYNIPLAALVGILAAEGGTMGEALSNKNGTWDMGAFQVNTCHLNELAQAGFTPQDILRDGYTNAHAAAWILRKEYNRSRNLWTAIGAYHSRTPRLHHAYIQRVRKHLERYVRSGRLPSLNRYQ